MTYEEIVMCYNTQARTDHSTRFQGDTPFGILNMTEDHHNWHLEKVIGVRCIKSKDEESGKEMFHVQIGGVYRCVFATPSAPVMKPY